MNNGRGGYLQKPEELQHYRAYIQSVYWEERKRMYFERHACACYICGDTDRVELNHIKYGNYGAEEDRDLVALCRTHHQKLHDTIGVRKNMHRQTEHYLEDEIAKYNAEFEDKPAVRSAGQPKGKGFANWLKSRFF